MTVAAQDPRTVPGALESRKARQLPDGGLIEFEFAPFGWLTKDGNVRRTDHRAYYWTPPITACDDCGGGGRVPGARAGTTKRCPTCQGTGEAGKRTRLPSVTTLLDAICPKPGLPPWAEARGIEGAIEAIRRGEIDPDDPASVERAVDTVRALRLGADRARDDAADRGLNIHALLQQYLETGEPPNPADHPVEHWGYIRALTRFLLKYEPEPTAIEELVAHPEDGYAGRLDLRAIVGGRLVTFDAKTSERAAIYSTAHAQVSLYERAAVRCGAPPADGLMVVVFAADGEYDVAAADHSSRFVDAALAWAREIKPVDSACESRNRRQRETRKAAAA